MNFQGRVKKIIFQKTVFQLGISKIWCKKWYKKFGVKK